MSRLPDFTDGLKHLRQVDPALRPHIKRCGPPALRPNTGAFESLARAIIYQQISGKAARSIYTRFRGLYPGKRFPKPCDVVNTTPDAFRSVGLSRQKSTYLHSLAEHFANGHINPRRFPRMSDDEIRDELTQIKGIGVWTVDMYLLFTLHRTDVLPVGDMAVQRGVQFHFGLDECPNAAVMRELTEHWAPYRSWGSWYMWRVYETITPGD